MIPLFLSCSNNGSVSTETRTQIGEKSLQFAHLGNVFLPSSSPVALQLYQERRALALHFREAQIKSFSTGSALEFNIYIKKIAAAESKARGEKAKCGCVQMPEAPPVPGGLALWSPISPAP